MINQQSWLWRPKATNSETMLHTLSWRCLRSERSKCVFWSRVMVLNNGQKCMMSPWSWLLTFDHFDAGQIYWICCKKKKNNWVYSLPVTKRNTLLIRFIIISDVLIGYFDDTVSLQIHHHWSQPQYCMHPERSWTWANSDDEWAAFKYRHYKFDLFCSRSTFWPTLIFCPTSSCLRWFSLKYRSASEAAGSDALHHPSPLSPAVGSPECCHSCW